MDCATSSLLLPTPIHSKDMDSNATSMDATSLEYMPSSPCPSASGSELSFASDAESTDYASTPPTSPTRVQEAFRRSLDASSSPSGSKQSLESLFSNFRIPTLSTTPPAASKTSKIPIPLVAPVTPSRTRPMLLSSLSSKRGAHSSPGLLDLSSVPRFPAHPSTSSFSSSATTPQGGLTPNGSTPKAVPDRPGLFSRWSTDSEGSGDGNDPDGEMSACTSPDCEVCEHDRKAAQEGMEQTTDFIRSPLPAGSPSVVASLLPPAPKPHQQGFSPFVDSSASSSSPMAPSTSISYFSQQPRHVSSPASFPTSRTCKKKLRNRAMYASSSSSGSNSDCFLKTPLDSPSAESPLSSPAIPAGPSKPLTRSQGLRIRDEGSKAKSRWGNRSLSAQLSASASISAAPGSSTIKTAFALLEGTISPAATTTDPLRVKLRQLPGAITPDSGMPPSPSPQSGSGMHYNQPHHQQHSHLYNRSLLTPELPRSPLHISSFPNSSSGNKSPNSSSKDSKDIFSKSFSFAASGNKVSPMGSPKFPLPSPMSSGMPAFKENTNPYFAGYV